MSQQGIITNKTAMKPYLNLAQVNNSFDQLIIYLSNTYDAKNQEFIDHTKKLIPPPIIEYPEDNKKELNFTLIGQMVTRQTSGVDMGYIMRTNSEVLASPLIRNTDNEEFPQLQILSVTDPNTVVCKSGFSSHVTCGKIIGLRDSISGSSDSLVLYDVVISDMEYREGDSGGPAYQ
ncbi:9786_t:CDS:2 [Gigaspora margarita]|uniref:9786_t:CDS:1 n=1 Tax=Gigaspora margarita TaxID=4874 RepID=A0ABN7V2K1_GIGMA|nr:9786_t:CDS:2 [Gigaspora margarita]